MVSTFFTESTTAPVVSSRPRAATIRATEQVGGVITCGNVATLSKPERNAIFSLMLYVAEEQDVRVTQVKSCVEEHFRLSHISRLRTHDFQDCVDFLLNLRLNEL